MDMQQSEPEGGMRRRATEWGVVLMPEDLESVPPVEIRMRRRLLAAVLIAGAGAILAVPMGPDADWSLRVVPAAVCMALGFWLLRPRRASERIEIEVDVLAAEVRVVECRDSARTVVSRDPIGEVGAIEVGRTIVSIPPRAAAAAKAGTGSQPRP